MGTVRAALDLQHDRAVHEAVEEGRLGQSCPIAVECLNPPSTELALQPFWACLDEYRRRRVGRSFTVRRTKVVILSPVRERGNDDGFYRVQSGHPSAELYLAKLEREIVSNGPRGDGDVLKAKDLMKLFDLLYRFSNERRW